MFEVVTMKEGTTVCFTTYVGVCVCVCVCVWEGGDMGGCMHLCFKDLMIMFSMYISIASSQHEGM